MDYLWIIIHCEHRKVLELNGEIYQFTDIFKGFQVCEIFRAASVSHAKDMLFS